MSVPLLRWDAHGPFEVAFSTRRGGVSDGAFVQVEAAAQLRHRRRTSGFDNDRVDRTSDVIEGVHQPVVLS